MRIGVVLVQEDCTRSGLDLLAEVAVDVALEQAALARLGCANQSDLYLGQHLLLILTLQEKQSLFRGFGRFWARALIKREMVFYALCLAGNR